MKHDIMTVCSGRSARKSRISRACSAFTACALIGAGRNAGRLRKVGVKAVVVARGVIASFSFF
jgi:hypothetical protein